MNYIKLEKYSTVNGPGVRVVLWVAGCSLHCKGCQNPETWDPNTGQPFTGETMKDLIEALNKPYIAGLTFCGGDPFFPSNRKGIADISRVIKTQFPDKEIWCYTGFTLSQIENDINIQEALKYIDVLIDGPFIESKRDIRLKWRGSSNQRVLDIPKTLINNQIVLKEGEN